MISASKMRDYLRKKCEQSWYLNPLTITLRISLKLKLFGLYSNLFVKIFSLIFHKTFGGGGGGEQKRADISNMFKQYQIKSISEHRVVYKHY